MSHVQQPPYPHPRLPMVDRFQHAFSSLHTSLTPFSLHGIPFPKLQNPVEHPGPVQ